MPLENADYISELNPAWPLGSDNLNESDDHHRLTKKAVQQSFPNVDKEVTATADDLNTLADAGNTGVLVPTGTILSYASATPPNGYLLCDGAVIDPQYTDLIALIGANTPDLRGQFLRGWSTDSSQDVEGPRAPLDGPQDQSILQHQHETGQSFNAGSGGNTVIAVATPRTVVSEIVGGAENRPKNITVAYIIKT